MTARKLTAKQEAFCHAYIDSGNASESARLAGIQFVARPPKDEKYVYLLLCPAREKILYVGKGTGRRMFQHVLDARKGRIQGLKKYKVLRGLLDAGCEPHPVVVATAPDDRAALRLERAFITSIGLDRLANGLPGQHHMDDFILAEVECALSRVMPYEKWLAVRPRADVEIALHLLLVAELQKMQTDPLARAREVVVANGRLICNRLPVDPALLRAA